jgi:hypothetical protein
MAKIIHSDQVFFDKESYNILLKFKAADVPVQLFPEVEMMNLNKKEEFHLTLIGTQEGFRLKDFFSSCENKEFIVTQVEELIKSLDIEVILVDRFYLLKKTYVLKFGTEDRMSIIQEIIIKNSELKRFYASLTFLTGLKFENRKTHITLYTKSTRNKNRVLGIGISSDRDFEDYMVREVFAI